MTYHGGPAFPLAGTRTGPESSGMTLRDYFAAAAIQGMLSDPDAGKVDWKDLAEEAYEAADAILAARERKTK
jgi:hypothetical protein